MSQAERFQQIQRRIQIATARSSRKADSVKLLAVSKTFPLSEILQFHALGQTAFGENYLQEAQDKITQLAESPNKKALEWHFIGPIQSNKTRPIAENFQWVHSIDRLKIAQRLSEQRPSYLPALNLLVQVNTSEQTSKSGVTKDEAIQLCEAVKLLPGIQLRGLMTIPSNTTDILALRAEFLQCKALLDQMNEMNFGLDTLSMGMSSDLELAIECGSTCVRIGTALFGQR